MKSQKIWEDLTQRAYVICPKVGSIHREKKVFSLIDGAYPHASYSRIQ